MRKIQMITGDFAKDYEMMVPFQTLLTVGHESIDAGQDLGNFTSCLRVYCASYLLLISLGEISAPAALPEELGCVDADAILERENLSYSQREVFLRSSLPTALKKSGTCQSVYFPSSHRNHIKSMFANR